MTTKTARHETLIDEAEQMLDKRECAKVAGLVWQAAFGATHEAPAKRELNWPANALETRFPYNAPMPAPRRRLPTGMVPSPQEHQPGHQLGNPSGAMALPQLERGDDEKELNLNKAVGKDWLCANIARFSAAADCPRQ